MFATLAHSPALLKSWLPLTRHVLYESSLAPLDRELLILRVAARTKSEYEYGQHAKKAAELGADKTEILGALAPEIASRWSAWDRLLLTAADELIDDSVLSESTWNDLTSRLDTIQMFDLIATIGQYVMLAWMLNSFRVQLDAGIEGFPFGPSDEEEL
jgi:alkylhydroperoxidase family enzyme